jgi:exodeoxyribonuclease X
MRPNLSTVLSVDVETTGLTPEDAEIVEIGVAGQETGTWSVWYDAHFRSSTPIPAEAAAVHGITDRMVACRPALTLRSAPKFLIEHTGFFTAHNAGFDRILLHNRLGERIPDGISDPDRWICTLRLARHLLPEATSHSLQYLRYHLDLPLDRSVAAHQAGPDALVGGYLLETLAALAISAGRVDPAADLGSQLARLARRPIPVVTWTIGKKYRGLPLIDLPSDYIEWAVLNLDSLNERNAAYDPDLAESVVAELIRRGGYAA